MKTNYIIGGVVSVIVIAVIVYFLFFNKKKEETKKEQPASDFPKTEEYLKLFSTNKESFVSDNLDIVKKQFDILLSILPVNVRERNLCEKITTREEFSYLFGCLTRNIDFTKLSDDEITLFTLIGFVLNDLIQNPTHELTDFLEYNPEDKTIKYTNPEISEDVNAFSKLKFIDLSIDGQVTKFFRGDKHHENRDKTRSFISNMNSRDGLTANVSYKGVTKQYTFESMGPFNYIGDDIIEQLNITESDFYVDEDLANPNKIAFLSKLLKLQVTQRLPDVKDCNCSASA